MQSVIWRKFLDICAIDIWKNKFCPFVMGIDISGKEIRCLALTKSHAKKYAVNFLEITSFEAAKQRDFKVVAALAANDILTKDIQIAADLTASEIENLISLNADKYFGISPNEINIAYQHLPSHINRVSSANQTTLKLIAAKTVSAQTHAQFLRQHGYKIKILDVDIFALQRSIEFLQPNLPSLYALVNIDHLRILLGVIDKSNLVYTQSYKFVKNAAYPVISEISKIIATDLQNFCMHQARPLKILFLCGARCAENDLSKELNNATNLTIQSVNIMERLDFTPNISTKDLIHIMPKMLISLGLALRGFNLSKPSINLLRNQTEQKNICFGWKIIYVSIALFIFADGILLKNLSMYKPIQKIQKQNVYLSDKLLLLRKAITIKNTLEAQERLIEKHQKAYAKISSSQQKIMSLIDELNKIVLDGIYLNSMTINNDDLIATGKAANATQLKLFIAATEQSQIMQKPIIEITENVKFTPNKPREIAFVLKSKWPKEKREIMRK